MASSPENNKSDYWFGSTMDTLFESGPCQKYHFCVLFLSPFTLPYFKKLQVPDGGRTRTAREVMDQIRGTLTKEPKGPRPDQKGDPRMNQYLDDLLIDNVSPLFAPFCDKSSGSRHYLEKADNYKPEHLLSFFTGKDVPLETALEQAADFYGALLDAIFDGQKARLEKNLEGLRTSFPQQLPESGLTGGTIPLPSLPESGLKDGAILLLSLLKSAWMDASRKQREACPDLLEQAVKHFTGRSGGEVSIPVPLLQLLWEAALPSLTPEQLSGILPPLLSQLPPELKRFCRKQLRKQENLLRDLQDLLF